MHSNALCPSEGRARIEREQPLARDLLRLVEGCSDLSEHVKLSVMTLIKSDLSDKE
jgi:hypothetical protein